MEGNFQGSSYLSGLERSLSYKKLEFVHGYSLSGKAWETSVF